MTLLAIMLLYYSRLGSHASFWALLPGLLIGGVGMALTMTPTTAAAMSSVPVDKAGVGSAVLNSHAPGRRLARDRGHGRDRRLGVRVGAGAATPGARSCTASTTRSRVAAAARARRRDRRDGGDPQAAAPSARVAGGGRSSRLRDRGTAGKPRLSADERRQAVLDTACRVFSQSSYRGATTAEIAREAGISEPILYRHFGSKRDLYLACLDEAWRSFREVAEQAIADDPDRCLGAIADAYMAKQVEDPPGRPLDPGADRGVRGPR